jgi:hypothetical protein
MGFVEQQQRIVPLRDLGQRIDGRKVPIHRIERFRDDPRRSGSTFAAPPHNRVIERLCVIMRHEYGARPRLTDAVMHTGMGEFIRDDQVAGARQGGEDGEVRGKAVRHIERRLGPEKRRRLAFQRLMLRRVAAQQARTARAHRHAREQQQGDDVGDLDHRVHGRAGRVLVGSPTVSPVTAALWASEPLPP